MGAQRSAQHLQNGRVHVAHAFEDGCARSVDGRRAALVGVAVVRVLFDERRVRFVFVREEFGVGLGEEVRVEELVVVQQKFLGPRRGVRRAEGLHRLGMS